MTNRNDCSAFGVGRSRALVRAVLLALTCLAPVPALAQGAPDNAARFGALPAVRDISISPDGRQVAYIASDAGKATSVWVVGVDEGAVPRRVMQSAGNPDLLDSCGFESQTRLLCRVIGRTRIFNEPIPASTMIAFDTDGSNVRVLSERRSDYSTYIDTRGGSVVDWLPDDPTHILMSRTYVPESHVGTRFVATAEGMGVDRINVENGRAERVVTPNPDAGGFFSDGEGHVRIMGLVPVAGSTGQLQTVIRYFVRPADGGSWSPLTTYDTATDDGIRIQVIDATSNRAFGFKRINGRRAAVAIALDGSGTVTQLYANRQVDVDGFLTVGRNARPVGISYATDYRRAVMLDSRIAAMSDALGRALQGRSITFLDASDGERDYLIRADSDTDAGQYYLFTPATRSLRPLLSDRPTLDSLTLAPMRPISYPATDGTMIPGYLTLPPGRTDARGLPGIVLPHGGPSARDEWGFDWLVQFFAASGYAVIQPNYRGSSGYGDSWYLDNGFQSWSTAIGDVNDAGRWLVAQGVDPAKLSIVGWSYGGYAALQSGVSAPGLFRSIVAIAPVTDLPLLRQEEVNRGNSLGINAMLPSGNAELAASPARQAGRISVPVLMFHGREDLNVDVEQSRRMRGALDGAGKSVRLVEYDGVGHQLETSEARTDMLRQIIAFLPH